MVKWNQKGGGPPTTPEEDEMNELIIAHTAGEFLVRTNLTPEQAVELIEDKWDLDITAYGRATAEDIEINQGQWTDLDNDV
jgi:hypothetical protein